MSDRPDNAGVRVPPPAFYALAVLVGYLLNQRWPFPISSSAFVQALAWLLVAVWLLLTITSFSNFRRSRTSIVPIRPATALVITGPYRFTRNPMYVALAVLTAALGLFLDNWWPIALLVPVLFVVRAFVIAPEERYLKRRFGADYVAYTQRVRRWL
jgi:protein-S-isoprenylcysteine O-methyltransferase Ste14